MDSSMIEIVTRITRIEDRLEVNLSQFLSRLEKLEQAEQQRAVDLQQAERKEMASLREELKQLKEQQPADTESGA